jgi:preprotein translocase subunit SecG
VTLIWTKLKDKKSFISKLLGYVGILFAVAAIAISILAGHSGASASWGYKIESTNSTSTP